MNPRKTCALHIVPIFHMFASCRGVGSNAFFYACRSQVAHFKVAYVWSAQERTQDFFIRIATRMPWSGLKAIQHLTYIAITVYVCWKLVISFSLKLSPTAAKDVWNFRTRAFDLCGWQGVSDWGQGPKVFFYTYCTFCLDTWRKYAGYYVYLPL